MNFAAIVNVLKFEPDLVFYKTSFYVFLWFICFNWSC